MTEQSLIPGYLIEDKELYIEIIIDLLKNSAVCTLIDKATTYNQALELIQTLPTKEPFVVVLDYNLTEDDRSGNDGDNLKKIILERNPNAIIVSSSPNGPEGNGVDFQLRSSFGGTKDMDPKKFDEKVRDSLKRRGLRT